MRILLTADLHLDDKLLNEYRWKVFKWLKGVMNEVHQVYILGDLLNKKDNHNSKFVNRVVDNLSDISKSTSLRILMGNHDYIDEDYPFFKFLNEIDNISYFYKSHRINDFLFFPNRKDVKETDFSKYNYVLTHYPIIGSVSDNGYKMKSGLKASFFKSVKRKVFSGDIHKPQIINDKFEYVGAPYSINFGDIDDYHCVVLDTETGDQEYIKMNFLKKHNIVISRIDDFPLDIVKKDDIVKVSIKLAKYDVDSFEKIRKQIVNLCEERQIILHRTQYEIVNAEKKGMKTLKKLQKKKEYEKSNEDYVLSYFKNEGLSDDFLSFAKEITDG